jgi:hypothetical protein
VTHVPGAPESETKISIQLGEAKRVPLDVAKPTAAPAATTPAATPAPAKPLPSAAAPAEPEPAHGSGRKTAAYVAGGFGIAGIVVGSVSGILVLGKKSTVSENCADKACNDRGLAAARSGKNLALVSDIGFGVGIAGLALGTIMLVTGSDSTTADTARARRWQPVLVAGNGAVGTGLFRRW